MLQQRMGTPSPTKNPTKPPSTQQAEPPPTDTSEATARNTKVNALPPAALDLAARLFDLARAGTTDELQQYLDAGIPPNLTNSSGDTLLMLAAYHGHVETVQMLIQKNADPNVLNERGQSPVAGAVFKGFDAVVRALVEAGADGDAGRPSAVDAARMFRREECCRILGVEMGDGSGGGEMSLGMIPGAPTT